MHIIILEFLRLVTPKKLFSSPCRLVSSIHELKHHHGYRGITLNRILLPTCGRWGNKPFQLSAPSGCLIWATFPHNHPLLSVQHSVTNRWGYRSPGCFDLKVLLDLDSSSMFLLPCPVSNKQLCCEMCFKMLRNKLWKRTEIQDSEKNHACYTYLVIGILYLFLCRQLQRDLVNASFYHCCKVTHLILKASCFIEYQQVAGPHAFLSLSLLLSSFGQCRRNKTIQILTIVAVPIREFSWECSL